MDADVALCRAEPVYPAAPPFHPHIRYPEYPFEPVGTEPNPIYTAVRETFRLLGLDSARYGTPAWNPLSEFIHPGDKVLVKPNLVLHPCGATPPVATITHPAVIRAVLDYALIALQGTGELTVGDAPLQKADFQRVLDCLGLGETLCFVEGACGEVRFRVEDFRLEQAVVRHGVVVERERQRGDVKGLKPVDLGAASFLAPIAAHYRRYRVTQYNPDEMTCHHNLDRNEYLIANSVLDADVLIELPKLKTHRKAGLTGALKNLIGINGCKDWLPHHRVGPRMTGEGDEYLYPCWRKRLNSWTQDTLERRQSRLTRYTLHWLSNAIFKSFQLWPPPDPYFEGSWWGNDTLWRTILDLNLIAQFADRVGQMQKTPQRRLFVLLDVIIAGEEEGPLEPRAKPCGYLVAGAVPAYTDALAARLMGFDYRRIPTIAHALRYLVNDPDLQRLRIIGPDGTPAAFADLHIQGLPFLPTAGWRGHIEME